MKMNQEAQFIFLRLFSHCQSCCYCRCCCHGHSMRVSGVVVWRKHVDIIRRQIIVIFEDAIITHINYESVNVAKYVCVCLSLELDKKTVLGLCQLVRVTKCEYIEIFVYFMPYLRVKYCFCCCVCFKRIYNSCHKFKEKENYSYVYMMCEIRTSFAFLCQCRALKSLL